MILYSNDKWYRKRIINFSIMEVSELSTTFYCSKLSHTQIKEIAKDTKISFKPCSINFFLNLWCKCFPNFHVLKFPFCQRQLFIHTEQSIKQPSQSQEEYLRKYQDCISTSNEALITNQILERNSYTRISNARDKRKRFKLIIYSSHMNPAH